MEITFNLENSIGIISLKGDLNVLKVDAFRQQFLDWFSPNPHIRDMVVDLTDVAMIDSAGLGLLISFLKHVRERGGELRLCGIQKRVSLVFDITRTRQIFGIHDTLEEALQTFTAD